MAVVDIKSAYRAVPIFPDHRRYLGLKWEINGETVSIEDSRLCFGLCLGLFRQNIGFCVQYSGRYV